MALRAALPEPGPGDASLGRLLLEVARELRTMFDRTVAGFGLTGQQAELLYRCSVHPDLTPNQLTRLLITDNAGVTRLVDRLERKGLISRRTRRTDRRSVTLRLTPSGRALIPRIARLAEARKRRLLAGISAADRERTRTVLRRILANVDELE